MLGPRSSATLRAAALAWVLWEETAVLQASGPPVWTVAQGYSSEERCQAEITETVAAFRERRQTRAPGYENILSVTAGSITHRFGDRVVSTRYVCLPDTVDPRPR